MAGSLGRDDLIKALGAAYANPTAKETNERESIKIESAIAGDKDVLRLVTNYDNSSKKNLNQNHPDVFVVSRLVDELAASGQGNIEIMSRELILKFNKAVESNDEDKITEIIATCKKHYLRLQSIGQHSPERALAYMVVIEDIKKM